MPFSQELVFFYAISCALGSKDALGEKDSLLERAKLCPENEILIVKNREIIRAADVLSMGQGKYLTANILYVLLKEIGYASKSFQPVVLPCEVCFSLETKSNRNENIEFAVTIINMIRNAASARLVLLPYINQRHFRLIVIDRVDTKVRLYDSGDKKYPGSNFMEQNIKIVMLVRKALQSMYRKEFGGEIPNCMQQSFNYDCGHNVLQRAKFLLNTKMIKTDIEKFAEELNYFNPGEIVKLNSELFNIILKKSPYADSDCNQLFVIKRDAPIIPLDERDAPIKRFIPLDESIWGGAADMGELKSIFLLNNYNKKQMWTTLRMKWKSVKFLLSSNKFKGDKRNNKKLLDFVLKHEKDFTL